MKKVSIVLPVYNGEETIDAAIKSILEQTYECFELIAVNDCSTDDSKKIIENYAAQDSRVRLIDNPRNMKLPRSLNIGFDNACGDYYTWTSDDNILLPGMLDRLVKELDQNTETGMVYSNYTNIDENGEKINYVELGQADELAVSNPIGACFLYRKEIAERVGSYDENLFLAEDYDYWIRIYKETKISHIDDNLYLYRRHSKSLTATKEAQIKKQVFKVLEKHFLFLYSGMQTHGMRNVFLDRLMRFAEDDEKERLRKALFKIYPLYRIHYLKSGFLK